MLGLDLDNRNAALCICVLNVSFNGLSGSKESMVADSQIYSLLLIKH